MSNKEKTEEIVSDQENDEKISTEGIESKPPKPPKRYMLSLGLRSDSKVKGKALNKEEEEQEE